MTTPAARPQRGSLSLWAALILLVIFLALTALVYFRDPSYSDAARLQELLGANLSGGKVSSTDWPQWRGANRDGVWVSEGFREAQLHLVVECLGTTAGAPLVSPISGALQIGASAATAELRAPAGALLASWPGDLLVSRKLWEQAVGAGFSAVTVAGGRAYTLFQDGDSEAVVCWDAATGKELWRYRYPAQYVSSQGSGPRSTPSVDGPYVYTVGATGLMHCLKTYPKTARGEVAWQKNLLADFGASNLPWGVSFSPLVEGELVFVNPGGPNGWSIVALDKGDGTVRWHALDERAGYSSPVSATLAGKPQVVFFTAEGAVGVSPADGTLYWRFPWKTSYDVNAATPIVVGDYVLISSGYNQGCVLLKIETDADGQKARLVYRNARLRCQFSSPVLYQDHIYGFDDSMLTCMDFRTGKVRWKERGFEKGSLIVADGRLIILGEYGNLALADATPEGYHALSAARFSDKLCWTMPVVAGGRLYLRNQERVLCVDLRAISGPRQ
jgi:outer membrane protein assembly factor BamB